METDDLWKLMNEVLRVHKELEHHVVRMMERQGDLEELTKQVAENNIRMGRILAVHDYDTEELDARLRRLEDRNENGRT
jgi:hypothetical protein